MAEYLTIPLSDLSVSKLNVRPVSKMGDIPALAASIEDQGLINPITVRVNVDGEGGYEILAGQRRFEALKLIQANADDGIAIEADCSLVEGDDAASRAKSLSENVHVEPMDAINQWKAFTALIKDGWSIEAISQTYSKPVTEVRRILALGNLPKYVLDAYEKDDIDAQALQYLAVAPKSRVTEWGKLYKSGDHNCPSYGHHMENFVSGGRKFCTDIALFDVKESGLAVVEDLFNENSFFADGEAFAVEQKKAIDALIKKLEGKGKKKRIVERMDENYFPQYEYPKVPLKEGGKIYVRVSYDGSVEVHKGHLPRRAAERLATGDDVKPDAPKPKRAELSAKAIDYVAHYMTIAAKAEVSSDPKLASCVLLASLICHSEDSINATGCNHFYNVANNVGDEEIYDTSTFAGLEKRRKKAYKPVFKGDSIFSFGWNDRPEFEAVLTTLLGMKDKDLNAIFCALTSEIISQNGASVPAIITERKPDMGKHWSGKTGKSFFNLVRNKTALFGMLEELTDKETVAAHEKNTIKQLQQLVADEAAKNPEWLPAYFSGASYDGGTGLDRLAPLSAKS